MPVLGDRSEPPGPRRTSAARDGGARSQWTSVVVVLAVAVLTPALVGIATALGLDPWAATAGAATAFLVFGGWLLAAHAAFGVILSWCLVTGFSLDGDAAPTLGSGDLWRFVVLTTAAVLGQLVRLRGTHRRMAGRVAR